MSQPAATQPTPAEQPYFMPRIGDTAPEFTAESTQGTVNYPSDYQGKWSIQIGRASCRERV